jgi:hypothetical protein
MTTRQKFGNILLVDSFRRKSLQHCPKAIHFENFEILFPVEDIAHKRAL